MKILITGTHFTPAQAVIEELRSYNEISPEGTSFSEAAATQARNDEHTLEIVYVGRKYTHEGERSVSAESKVLPSLGVKFIPITTGRINRYLSVHTFISLFKIPIGFLQGAYLVLKEQPDLIVSFGGYVSVPVVISAWLFSIPIIIHEQTLVTSFSGFITGLFADKIALTFENANYLKSKVILTGNPIRKEIINPTGAPSQNIKEFIEEAKKEKKPIIFVTGGNQGSTLINNAVLGSIEKIIGKAFIIHQTGDYKDEFQSIKKKKESIKNPKKYLIQKWFDATDVSFILRNASLVICRSGINTLLELAYFGIPTITIPLSFFFPSEQQKNAEYFHKKGLVQIIKQKDLNSPSLLNKISLILSDLNKYKKQAENGNEIVILNAEKKLAQKILMELAQPNI